MLFWLAVGLLTGHIAIGEIVFLAVVSIGLAACWFIGLGSLFLFWLGRRYAMVERFHCLALCATLSFLLPLVIVLIELGIETSLDLAASLGAILGAAATGLLIAPLGLFSGWVLWRIAIRPAALPVKDLAEAF